MNDSLTCPPHIAEALRRAGGTNDYGEPNYRLIHAANARHPQNAGVRSGRLKYPIKVSLKQEGWSGRNPLSGQSSHWPMSAQPPALPGMIITPVYVYEDEPRPEWVLESWWPPELACDGWEASRWTHRDGMKRGAVIDERLVKNGFVDILGEPPTRGEYRFVMYCRDEHGRPMAISDARLIEILQLAVRQNAESGMSDYWRTRLPEGKSAQVVSPLHEDREREQRELDDEFGERVEGIARLVAQQALGLDRKYSFAS
jgi:hypothetical protein